MKNSKTSLFNTLHHMCDLTLRKNQFNIFIAQSGFGKTYSIEKYIAPDGYDIIHLTIDVHEGGISFYSRLINKLTKRSNNVKYSGVTINELINRFSYDLIQKTKRTLIIIDEAGNFTKGMMPTFRSIYDKVKGRCGLLLVGPPKFLKHLYKWNSDEASGIPELMTRIHNIKEFPKILEKDDKELICFDNQLTKQAFINAVLIDSKFTNLRYIDDIISEILNGYLTIDEYVKRVNKFGFGK